MSSPTRTERRLSKLVEERRQIEDSVQLVVTVLGDGKGQPGFGKRRTVKEHLLGISGIEDVTLPEDLHVQNPTAHVEDIETAAIEEADVVICIEAPSGPPLGLYTELVKFFDPNRAERWYRIHPSQEPGDAERPALVEGFAADAVASIGAYEYEVHRWESCETIRAACAKRVEQAVSLARLKAKLNASD